jgi:hypothetical protein
VLKTPEVFSRINCANVKPIPPSSGINLSVGVFIQFSISAGVTDKSRLYFRASTMGDVAEGSVFRDNV